MKIFPRIRAGVVLPVLAVLVVSCQTKPSADFLAADTNGSKSLDQAELHAYTAKMFLVTYDSNGDGGVSFREWQQVKPEANPVKFASRDTDKNGKIDAVEMLGVVRKSPTFGPLMQTLDINKDGLVDPAEGAQFRKHMDEL